MKTFFQNNIKYIIFYIIFLGICFIPLPYVIEAPGGLINLDDRIKVENSYDEEGSLNLSYVSEYPGSIPLLIVAMIRNDWNIEKKEESKMSNETYDEAEFRYKTNLQEAISNATLLAFNKAGKSIKEENCKLYVTYVYEDANTNLEIGDLIIKINGYKFQSKQEIKTYLNTLDSKEKLEILVENNGKDVTKYAYLNELDNRLSIGIVISKLCEYETDPSIKIHTDSSESGGSGGLMTSLSIYNKITEEDITRGKKIVGTGTIDENGNVGEIAGIFYKLKGAVNKKADIFLAPAGDNYEDAIKYKKKYNYDIKIYEISTFDEAVKILKSIK